MRCCYAYVESLVEFWDSFQVELQGKYSVDRLHAFRQFEAGQPSRLRSLLIGALVPVPCLVFVVATDLIPLSPPSDPFERQRIGFFVRCMLAAFLPSYVTIAQFSRVIPELTISTRRSCAASVLIALVTYMTTFVWTQVVGFPVPFLIHIQTGPVMGMVGFVMWMTWKDKLRADASLQRTLKRRILVTIMQATMLQVYFAYIVIFMRLPNDKQIYFTMLLPLIKLVFKNLVNNGLDGADDFAPAYLVSHVDTFHTLFVTLMMQSGTSQGTVVFIMIIDTIQSVIALGEISVVLSRLQKAAERDAELAYGSKPVSLKTIQQEVVRELEFGVAHLAVQVLESNPHVCSKPELAAQRMMRRIAGGSRRNLEVFARSTKVAAVGSDVGITLKRDLAQFELVQLILKLLHMIEFYVLVEFVEVVMASFYALYLCIISFLPNRVYYSALKGLTPTAIQANAYLVAEYAVMELVSLVVFCLLMQRRVKRPSALNQLVFTLEKHWSLIQSPLFMWVFLLFNLTLDHYGTDTTFKFEWLKSSKQPHV